MGVELNWQGSVLLALKDKGIEVQSFLHENYSMLLCNGLVAIHLIPLGNVYKAEELIVLQRMYQLKGVTVLQLWQDVWYSRSAQVLGRIKSVLGLNKRLYGRKAKVVSINQQQADDFLNDNHLQGSAKSRYKYALVLEGELIAVACFSNVRYMKKIAPGYRSVELIRFATRIGFTVTGGFTRLLKHLIKTIGPDDVMSYADRDWSLGNAYQQAGFKLTEVTLPASIWLRRKDMQRFFSHRLPADALPGRDADLLAVPAERAFIPVFNTGNLKYLLYLKSRQH
ncbi:hypothetical protein [Pedobacter africanus]|uniref:Uncharacterized protein n=1 Tax=Pedobacter africanus TaxID=151894 RepID=A0A1W2DGY1_9SPHI|nr:hypothetical protein [Pedobacter africanus]SMC96392.1 hypothetical protein SAMN04488524_3767 [Pedobacter africanus]